MAPAGPAGAISPAASRCQRRVDLPGRRRPAAVQL